MNSLKQVYTKIIILWMDQLSQQNIQSNKSFQQFRKAIVKSTKMEIDYDSSIVPIIIQELQGLIIPSQSKRSSKLNALVKIVQILYDNLFINKNDVNEIMKHLHLKEEQVKRFNQSTILDIEARWKMYIRYNMDIFWIIVPYKSIDIALQIQLYQQTWHCKLIQNNLTIKDYYHALIKLKKSKQRSKFAFYEESPSSKLHNTADTNKKRSSGAKIYSQFDEISSICSRSNIDESEELLQIQFS